MMGRRGHSFALALLFVALGHAASLQSHEGNGVLQQPPAPVNHKSDLPPPHVAVDSGRLDDEFFRVVKPTRPDAVPLGHPFYPPRSSDSAQQGQKLMKAKNDRRTYRRLQLDNGLDVMLIRDRFSGKGSAAMDIGAGNAQDPTDKPGLAHFLEHMLFMGSKKYPSMETYNDYINNNGGFNNAYTSTENTNYYFDVSSRSLYDALDIFADIFKNPLFNETAISKELTAVESEHAKDQDSDPRRVWQLLRYVANPELSFHRGAFIPLRSSSPKELQEALVRFHKTHYHAENMRLVVLGPQSLSSLEKWVKRLFSDLPKASHPPPFLPAKLSTADIHQKIYSGLLASNRTAFIRLKPVKFQRQLVLLWPLPPQSHKYASKSVHFISSLFEQESKGSLYSVLKRMGLITYVDSFRDSQSGFDLLRLQILLTKQGASTWNVRRIVAYVFQYIRLIEKAGVERWRWRELGTIAAIRFRLRHKDHPRKVVSTVAADLRKYDPLHILVGKHLFLEYDPVEIQNLLSRMVPNNTIVTLIHKDQCCMNKEEPFYKTGFRQDSATEEEHDLWQRSRFEDFEPKSDVALNMAMPERNPFMPTSLDIKPTSSKDKLVSHPMIVRDIVDRTSNSTGSQRLWFKQDGKFKEPYAVFVAKFWSGAVYGSPRDTVMATLYVALVQDVLDELLFPAEFVGFNWGISTSKDGLFLRISGYDSNIEDLVQIIAQNLQPKLSRDYPSYPAGFVADESKFALIKEEIKQRYRNSIHHSQAYQYASHALSLLLETPHWQFKEYSHSVDDITLSDLVHWAKGFFSDSALEGYITGNLQNHEATQLFDFFTNNIHWRSGSQALRTVSSQVQRVVKLDGAYIFSKHTPHKADPNSAVYHYYQAGFGNFFDDVCAEMVSLLIDQPAFTQLRTREQLGYIVRAGLDRRRGVNGIYVMVQSSRKPAEYLDKRIRNFLFSFRKYIAGMSEARFKGLQRAMMYRKLGRPGSLLSEASSNWEEISSQEYRFDRQFRELIAIRFLSKPRFLAWVDKVIGYKSVPSLLAVRVQSHLKPNDPLANATAPAAPVAAAAAPAAAAAASAASAPSRSSAKATPLANPAPPMDSRSAAMRHSTLGSDLAAAKAKRFRQQVSTAPVHHSTHDISTMSAADPLDSIPVSLALPKKIWHMPVADFSDPDMMSLVEVEDVESMEPSVVYCPTFGAADPRCKCAKAEYRQLNDNCNAFRIRALTPTQSLSSVYPPGQSPFDDTQQFSNAEPSAVLLRPKAPTATATPSALAPPKFRATAMQAPNSTAPAAPAPPNPLSSVVQLAPASSAPAAPAIPAPAAPAAPSVSNNSAATSLSALEPVVKLVNITETTVKERTVHWLVEYSCSRSGPRRYHHPAAISIESVRTFKSSQCVFPKQKVGTVIIPPFAVVKGYENESLD